MKKGSLFFIILLTILSCETDGNKENQEFCYLNANSEVLLHKNIDREYILYIPDSYDGSTSVPLMLNFHGFGGSASNFMVNADMRPVAEANNFILVYPQGSCSEGSSHWNPCPIGGDNKSTADDVGFIESLIEKISSQYNIDLERVYVAGYSNGSMMAYGLANYKSELIAAVASVSGAMLGCIGPTSHPMPVVHFHGTFDEVIPYDGNGYYDAVQSTLDYWINFNNANTTPSIYTDNSGTLVVDHYVYDQGDNSVSVEHYKYNGGEHAWFNTTYQGQNTSELIWSFVSQYDINGLR